MRKRLLAALVFGALLVPPSAGRAIAFAKTSETESAFSAGAPRGRSDGPAEYPVVVVAIDGVRPREIFQGEDPAFVHRRPLKGPKELTPNLHALGENARLFGNDERVTSSGPNYVSLPGYTEMFTGARPTHCTTNECGRTPVPTVVDALAEQGKRATVVTSWERICLAAAMNEGILDATCGRSHGHLDTEGDGTLDTLLAAAREAGPGPGHGDYRPDVSTAEIALRVLETKRPDFLFVGLGDTDEYAHASSYDGYLGALVKADAFVGEVRARLAYLGERGQKTTLIVVTDHGRAQNFRDHGGAFPESRFGFMMVEGPLVGRSNGTGNNLTLGDVGRGAGALLGVAHEPSAFGRWITDRR